MLGGIYSCSFDPGISVYFTKTASFSFTPLHKANATLIFKMYECAYNPKRVNLTINGICTIEVENRASGGMNIGLTAKSVEIDSSCLIDGENTITIEGDTELSLGSGACPSLSCLGAKLYADFIIPEQSLQLLSSGSVSTDSVLSNYTFDIPVPVGAEGKFTLPAGAALLSCPECSPAGGAYKVGVGNHTINYLIENLHIGVAYPNTYSAFLKNETPNFNITTSYAGFPVPSKIYYSNRTLACDAPAGACELSLPMQGVGLHSLEIQALESQVGRRGKVKIEFAIDPDPTVSFIETSDAGSIVGTYQITNPTHLPFSPSMTYLLPEDNEGNFSITPWPPGLSSNSTSLSFSGSCPPYSNSTYRIIVKAKGVFASISPPVFPKSARVGEPLLGRGKVSLTNANTKRSMASRGSIPNCTSGCSWDLVLAPSEAKSLEYSLSLDGASECGSELLGGAKPDEAALRVCVRVPGSFPAETSPEYLLPWASLPGYSRGLEARLGGSPIPIATGASGALLALGPVSPGNHYISISYLRTKTEPDRVPEKNEIMPSKENGFNEETQAQNPAPPKTEPTTIAAPERSKQGEVVQIIVLSGDAPAVGELSFISPSGKISLVQLDGGRVMRALEEPGVWVISFNGKEWNILVESKGGVEDVFIAPTGQKQSDSLPSGPFVGKTSQSFLGLELGPWVLLLLAVPFLAMPALGYFLIIASRGPQASVSKSYDGRKVLIGLENRGGLLTDIWITDALPEDAVVGDAGGGSFKKTIFGNVLKWRLPSLDGGAKWSATYELRTTAGKLGVAKISATDMKGGQVKASSIELEMDGAAA